VKDGLRKRLEWLERKKGLESLEWLEWLECKRRGRRLMSFILTIVDSGYQNDRHYHEGKNMTHHPWTCASVAVFIACSVLFLPGCWGPGKGKPGGGAGPGGPGRPGGSFLSTAFDTQPFNTDVDKLPPMYTGHNPELLYSSIQMRRQSTAREAQETEEHYRTRMAQEISLPLMGTMDFDSIHAFRITPAEVRYDERNRVMSVSCRLSVAFEAGREDAAKKAFMVRYLPQLDNRYAITREDGTRVNIEEIKFSEYAVVAANAGGLPIESTAVAAAGGDRKPQQGVDRGSDHERIETTIKMTPEEARRIEGGIMALLVGKLAPPYASQEEISRKPSKEQPGTYLGIYHYLYLDLIEIWFYDVTSGTILKRMPSS